MSEIAAHWLLFICAVIRSHLLTWQLQSHWRAAFSVIPNSVSITRHRRSVAGGYASKERNVLKGEAVIACVWLDGCLRVTYTLLACSPIPRLACSNCSQHLFTLRHEKRAPAVPIHLIRCSLTHRARHPRTCRELARISSM